MRALARLLGFLLFAFALTAPVIAVPTVAHAQAKKQGVDALIKKGQDLFDEQRYEESIQTLSAALMRPGISRDDKIRVYQLLAYNYIVLQQEDEADAAVRGLLVVDPEFSLPETESPRFRDFFENTRTKWNDEGRPGFEIGAAGGPPVTLKHSAPAQVESGLAISLTGNVEDPKAVVDKVVLYYRSGSSGKFKTAKVKYAMHKFSAEIPADAVEPPLVEYYVQALDANGLPVASRGDSELPLRIAVPEESSIISSPGLWVPVGIGLVATAVVTVLVVGAATGLFASESTVSVNVFEQ
jgi:hypothetical protein